MTDLRIADGRRPPTLPAQALEAVMATEVAAVPAPKASSANHLRRVALVYGLSRLVTLLFAWMANFLGPARIEWPKVWPVLAPWDGVWYTRLIVEGYPRSVPPGEGGVAMTTLAFFPGFPLAARAVHHTTGLSAATSGAIVSMAGGLIACIVLWKIVNLLANAAVAHRAVTLFCFMPGAFAFTLAYSEGVFLAAATTSLYGLLTKRWWLAGLAAAVATGTRPTGIILIGCCLWAAVGEFRRTRSWRPFLAPLLAPVGLLGYAVYLIVHTGSVWSWTETEKRGWGQHFNFGATTLKHITEFFTDDPFKSVVGFFGVTAILVLVAAGVLLARRPIPSVLIVYMVGMMVFPLGDALLVSTQRYLLSAFPIVIPFARVLRGASFTVVAAFSGATMMLLLVLATTTWTHVP